MAGKLVLMQNLRPDRFFTAEQCARLEELMVRWRAARDAGLTLSAVEQAELERLMQEELAAAGRRSAALSDELEE